MKFIPNDRPVSYVSEGISCGKQGCRKCPHGPYWYAYWKSDTGKTVKGYVGRALNVDSARGLRAEPPPAEAEPPPPPPPRDLNGRPPAAPAAAGNSLGTPEERSARSRVAQARVEARSYMRPLRSLGREAARKKVWNRIAAIRSRGLATQDLIDALRAEFRALCLAEGWAPPK